MTERHKEGPTDLNDGEGRQDQGEKEARHVWRSQTIGKLSSQSNTPLEFQAWALLTNAQW
jgi:hypothetical protein